MPLGYVEARALGVFTCGHPRAEGNTYTYPSGSTACRQCRRDAGRESGRLARSKSQGDQRSMPRWRFWKEVALAAARQEGER